MVDALFRKKVGGLRPEDERARRLLDRVPENDLVEVRARHGRSVQQMRFYRAVLSVAVEKTEAGRLFRTPDALHLALKLHLGYVEEVVQIDGTIVLQAQSARFDAMPHEEFTEFVEAALRTLAEEYGVDVETLRLEAEAA